MSIRVMSSTQAQKHFDQIMEDAKNEAIMIQENGRDQVILLAAEEYEAMLAAVNTPNRVKQLHEKSIEEFDEVYKELAK